MAWDGRLVRKGQSEALQALLDQAGYQVTLARQHAEALATWNWRPEETEALAAEVAALNTGKWRQLEEQAAARAFTRGEHAAVSEAKGLIGRLRNVARLVVRAHPEAEVPLEAFNAGGPLVRQTPKILAYLQAVRVPAAKLDEAFRPYLRGESVVALIDAAKAKLEQANATQEVDIASLPADTVALYERKGRVLRLIEDLNAIARNAFYDEPEIKARFNKALLNRARRKAPTPAAPTPDAPTPDAPTPEA